MSTQSNQKTTLASKVIKLMFDSIQINGIKKDIEYNLPEGTEEQFHSFFRNYKVYQLETVLNFIYDHSEVVQEKIDYLESNEWQKEDYIDNTNSQGGSVISNLMTQDEVDNHLSELDDAKEQDEKLIDLLEGYLYS